MKIGIIGAGAVGATAAYYLSQHKDNQVTVFDDGNGQATKAAAGIICPWFSKRRNKAWYRLARLGADFYQELISDLEKNGVTVNFHQQTGVILTKKNEDKLDELYSIAESRKLESPLIGDLKFISIQDAQNSFPELNHFNKALFASGGARVDGSLLTQTLLDNSNVEFVSKKVKIEKIDSQYIIEGQLFDKIILAAGAWLSSLLEPLGYRVDCRAQKGQLRDYYFKELDTSDYPVLMPEGEIDIIPFPNGKISVGASHENDKGFNLSFDQTILDRMEADALLYYPKLKERALVKERVGIRAYTSDFSPFFGCLPNDDNVYLASGLGSTGLTIGPLIGRELAKAINGKKNVLDFEDYPVSNYISLFNNDMNLKK